MPPALPLNLTPPTIPPSLTHHSITLHQWRHIHPRLSNLCVGALIFRPAPHSHTPQILLIKRASTDFYPNVWEIPGGSVEPTDASLLSSVVREVWEETGLRVTSFQSQVWDRKAGAKVMGGANGEEQVVGQVPGIAEVEFLGGRGERWGKLNLVVGVGGMEEGAAAVVLDPDEHQDWGWFGADAVREKGRRLEFISEQALAIVENGFEVFEESVRGK